MTPRETLDYFKTLEAKTNASIDVAEAINAFEEFTAALEARAIPALEEALGEVERLRKALTDISDACSSSAEDFFEHGVDLSLKEFLLKKPVAYAAYRLASLTATAAAAALSEAPGEKT